MLRSFAQRCIRVYQKTLSPDHGWFSYWMKPTCKFHPTCSQYAYDVIGKYGIAYGLIKTIWRILRCHPWSKGGIDPA